MKISLKVLSIPPFISTAWKNVSSLHVREKDGILYLTVSLHNGSAVEIPNLNQSALSAIFDAHARAIEAEKSLKNPTPKPTQPFNIAMALDTDGGVADVFDASFRHNPEQSDLPPLPSSLLQKITNIAKALGFENFLSLPKSEPNCSCIYCQLMNSLQENIVSEEPVSDEDLKFRNWDISQAAEKLYTVTNPLDPNEHYNVFLGTPIGCTCGHKNCEHVKAVLST